MTLEGTLIVLWYTIKPWLWLIIALLLVLMLSFWITSKRKSTPSKMLKPIVAAVSLILIGFIPFFTKSSWLYVNTWVDWLGIFAASVGIVLYTYWLLKPLFMKSHE